MQIRSTKETPAMAMMVTAVTMGTEEHLLTTMMLG